MDMQFLSAKSIFVQSMYIYGKSHFVRFSASGLVQEGKEKRLHFILFWQFGLLRILGFKLFIEGAISPHLIGFALFRLCQTRLRQKELPRQWYWSVGWCELHYYYNKTV